MALTPWVAETLTGWILECLSTSPETAAMNRNSSNTARQLDYFAGQQPNIVNKIIIEGVTRNGRKFRPSDWAERMSGALSTFGRDHRIHYSPLLKPLTINGVKCVAVDPRLEKEYPEMYAYIMGWANNNELKVYSESAPGLLSTN